MEFRSGGAVGTAAGTLCCLCFMNSFSSLNSDEVGLDFS